jgi:ArsR family transcriptional regulator, virulence genes transcriptional regulator
MKRTATGTKPAMAAAVDFDASAMRKHSADAARLMRSLANRQRLLVLCALAEGELSVSELNRRVTLSQSALSQHLAVLRNEQLVSTTRDAQTIYYSLADGPAVRVLQLLHDEFCGAREPKSGR